MARRDEYDPSADENRMWCPECNGWRLAKKKRQTQDLMGQLAGGLIGVVCSFLAGGLLCVGIFVVLCAVAASMAPWFNKPKYLCSRCGSETYKTRKLAEASYAEDDDE